MKSYEDNVSFTSTRYGKSAKADEIPPGDRKFKTNNVELYMYTK